MEQQPTPRDPSIRVTLLSSVLELWAHNGPLQYSGFIKDGTDRITVRVFAEARPHLVGQVLHMDNAEIQLDSGGALLVEEFLRDTASYVNQRQLNFGRFARARA